MTGCERCGVRLPTAGRGRIPRFCSTRCRVAAHRAHRTHVPAELAAWNRWVRYSSRKVPLRLNGRAASSTDPATWVSHAAAAKSKTGAGLGFVLNGDGIICIDLDHCFADGRPTSAAQLLLDRLPVTYVEVSPSGAGLHIWGYGAVAHGRRTTTVDGLAVEVYGTGRYMTVTGKPVTRAPFADLSAVLADPLLGVRHG